MDIRDRPLTPPERRPYLLETREGYITDLNDPFGPRTQDPREAATVFGVDAAWEMAHALKDQLGLGTNGVWPVKATRRVYQYHRRKRAMGDDGMTLLA